MSSSTIGALDQAIRDSVKGKPYEGVMVVSCFADVLEQRGHVDIPCSKYARKMHIRETGTVPVQVTWAGRSSRPGPKWDRTDDGVCLECGGRGYTMAYACEPLDCPACDGTGDDGYLRTTGGDNE